MKRILNNIGAISKQAIVGSVIGVATLAVGVGLMNNFSKSGSSEEGFASNAIERSGYSYDSVRSGASAQDIMSARNYAQSGKEGSVSVITGTENLALNRRNSAKNASLPAGADQAAAGGVEGGQDGSQGYADGEIEGMGTSNKVAVNISEEDAAAAQAQRDAKIAKGKELSDKAKASLKTSKMADSSGIKGIATGSTSMTYGSAGGTGMKDSSKINLSSNSKLANSSLQGANGGSLSAMGVKSVGADGKRGRSSLGSNHETLGDLGRASKYSLSGKNAVSGDAAKGAADAAAAFDGSQEAEAVSLDGENVQQAALNALDDLSDLDTSKIKDSAAYIKQQQDKYNELVKKANVRYWAALGVAVGCCVAAFAVIEAKAGGPWCYLIAGAICTVGAATIAGVLWGGGDSYANSINEIDKLSQSNGGITPSKKEMWTAGALFGMLNALMAAAFVPSAGFAVAMGAIEEIIRMRKPTKM